MNCTTVVAIVISTIVILSIFIVGAICCYQVRSIKQSIAKIERDTINTYKHCISQYKRKKKDRAITTANEKQQRMTAFEQKSKTAQININDFLK